MEYYDTIIIGAGLAGCTLGNLLLEQNKTVLIIENQDVSKKDKLCGGLVTYKAYNLLLKIYGNKIKKLDFKKFNSFKVKNNDIIKEVNKQNIYSINRKELDVFIVSEFLKKGGKILDNTSFDKIDFNSKIIYTSKKKFKYKILVGADGVLSRVRKELTGKKQKMNFAIETESSNNEKEIQIDFLNKFIGYAWTIPNNKTVLIGLGNVNQNKDIKNTFLEHFNLNVKTPIKGAFLPTGNEIMLKKKDVFFIGDAAGLVSPVIGEGIYYALSSAYILSASMNSMYKIKMLKNRILIFSHRISKLLIYNSFIRNIFYRLYGKFKIITFLINLVLKTLL